MAANNSQIRECKLACLFLDFHGDLMMGKAQVFFLSHTLETYLKPSRVMKCVTFSDGNVA